MEQKQSHLYKLNTSVPYEVDIWRGIVTAIILIIIGTGLWVASIVIFVSAYTKSGYYSPYPQFGSGSPLIALFPLGIGTVFLIVGIIVKKKDNETKAFLNEAVLNGYVTFGKIESVRSWGWGMYAYQHGCELRYTFTDENGQSRSGVSGLRDFKGDIAILFYQDKSWVLKRYELLHL